MKTNKTKRRNRSNNELAAEVVKFDLAKVEDLAALEMLVRSSWSVAEVEGFQHCLHGGDFTSKAGWSRKCMSGIIAATKRVDYALTRLWERLLADCWRMVGAASVLHVEGSMPFKWLPTRKMAKNKKVAAITGDIELLGRDDALFYKSYSELTQLVGNAYAAQTNTQSSLQKKLDAYEKKFGPLEK